MESEKLRDFSHKSTKKVTGNSSNTKFLIFKKVIPGGVNIRICCYICYLLPRRFETL